MNNLLIRHWPQCIERIVSLRLKWKHSHSKIIPHQKVHRMIYTLRTNIKLIRHQILQRLRIIRQQPIINILYPFMRRQHRWQTIQFQLYRYYCLILYLLDFLLTLFSRGDFHIHTVYACEEEVLEYLAFEELFLVPTTVYSL